MSRFIIFLSGVFIGFLVNALTDLKLSFSEPMAAFSSAEESDPRVASTNSGDYASGVSTVGELHDDEGGVQDAKPVEYSAPSNISAETKQGGRNGVIETTGMSEERRIEELIKSMPQNQLDYLVDNYTGDELQRMCENFYAETMKIVSVESNDIEVECASLIQSVGI